MKKHLLVAAVLIAALMLSSCQSADNNVTLLDEPSEVTAAETTQTSQYTVGLVMKTLTNPFFVDMEKGARVAEEEFGISLIVRTGAKETSIEQQIQIVEEFIASDVDGIVIAPGDSTELVSVLKKAQDSGIKIVNIDNRLDAAECAKQGLTGVPFISVKNDEGAYLSVKEITKNLTEKTQAVILEGILEAENSKLRVEGANSAFGESPYVEIVMSKSANWKIDEAYALSKELFETYPNVKLAFCANDMMALGMIQYLKEADRRDVLVAGFDNLEDARAAIAQGWMTVTIDQQASQQGYLGVKTVVDMINNIPVEEETYVPVQVVSKENIE